MMIDLLQGADETIEKTFMCYKGGLVGVHHRPPLVFVVITSKAIYLCDHVHESHLFSLELRINLEDIKDIVVSFYLLIVFTFFGLTNFSPRRSD